MRTATAAIAGALGIVVIAAVAAVAYVRSTGLESRSTPGAVEARVAAIVRRLAVSSERRDLRNPVSLSSDVLAEGMAHFADHCANCHSNDGSGTTEMGHGLYPKAPDMRLPATQQLTDGELFYIIENGIRFTGMPAWSTGTASDAQSTWHLVHFIRHLPQLTGAELERMQALNPRSPEEFRQEIEEERFLNQGAQ